MENKMIPTQERSYPCRFAFAGIVILTLGAFAFLAGVALSSAQAAEGRGSKKAPRVVYPRETALSFEGLALEGEIKNPGEFYFQRRNEEKFDSLIQRRKNFHREMLRDVVSTR
jgi:hypothetical protein